VADPAPATSLDLVKLPRTLQQSVALGNCVAFVGAGFSKMAGMPSWQELLQILWDQANDQAISSGNPDSLLICKQCIDAGEFLIAASEIRETLHVSDVNRVISNQFREARLNEMPPKARGLMLARMEALSKGPWAGIITTNYDSLIERGLADHCPKSVAYVLTPDGDLGLALNRTGMKEIFFVKIHGTINTGTIVLTSEEYQDAYFKNSKISNFLIAAMMTYNFVFIGSSIEDEILRIRQRLCADYGGGVPLAYALMPATEANVRKSRWLLKNARIQVILYPSGRHEALDELLEKFCDIERTQSAKHFPSTAQMATVRAMRLQDEKRAAVGLINLAIIRYIQQACAGVLTKEQILRLAPCPTLPGELARMSRDELFYRVVFLVGCGLLSESEYDDKTLYEVEE
jgi:hypothetical protein